jgi:hypothetical protein
MRRALRRAVPDARRYPELCPSVTHAVVGSRATPQELQALRDFLSRNRGVHVVRPDWLRLCAHERRLVPLPDERCTLTVEATMLARGGGAAAGGAAEGGLGAAPTDGAAAAAGVFSQSASGRGGALAAAATIAAALAGEGSRSGLPAGCAPAAAPDFWEQPAPDGCPERMFRECWFTLAALASDKAAEAEAAELVRCGGGGRRAGPARQPLPPLQPLLMGMGTASGEFCCVSTTLLPPHPAPQLLPLRSPSSVGGRIFVSPSHLPSGAIKRFAVCPHSLLPGQAAQLERSNACFAAVHPSCRITLPWIKLSFTVRMGACGGLAACRHVLLILALAGSAGLLCPG